MIVYIDGFLNDGIMDELLGMITYNKRKKND
jgi:hypothetical protein